MYFKYKDYMNNNKMRNEMELIYLNTFKDYRTKKLRPILKWYT